jgi:hypothetical protein
MSGCREGQWPRIGPAAYTGPSRQALRAGCQASRFDSLGDPAEASAHALTPSKADFEPVCSQSRQAGSIAVHLRNAATSEDARAKDTVRTFGDPDS